MLQIAAFANWKTKCQRRPEAGRRRKIKQIWEQSRSRASGENDLDTCVLLRLELRITMVRVWLRMISTVDPQRFNA